MDNATSQKAVKAQKGEITEHFIYRNLAKRAKNDNNRNVLRELSEDEFRHYELWKKYTGHEIRPGRWRIWLYGLLSRVLGLTFSLKLMERGEGEAQLIYRELAQTYPGATQMAEEEEEHETRLLGMLEEDRLKYVGSMILGLNDALVELSGALAGFTLALREPGLIATVGLITGIAAALSMAGTEYLASKTEKTGKAPLKAALYTGGAYIITVMLLIAPYLIFNNVYLSLGIMLVIALVIIMAFNFYVSVAQEQSFRKNFTEMAVLSLGIAAVSFGIGYIIRTFLGIEI